MRKVFASLSSSSVVLPVFTLVFAGSLGAALPASLQQAPEILEGRAHQIKIRSDTAVAMLRRVSETTTAS